MTAPAPADQRTALQAVTGAALADLAAQWATLDLNDAAQVKATLQELLPALADEYGAAASELAVDVYESLREAEGFTSDYAPQIAAVVDTMPSRARWAADPLFDRADPQPAVALVRAQESVQLAVADQYRETVMDTAIDDPEARGWQRVVRPGSSASGPCPFCELLASRGAVYTRKSVDFGAHGLCHCIAVPAWGGREVPVKPFEATGNSTPEQRAQVYRYMRKHGLLSGTTRGD